MIRKGFDSLLKGSYSFKAAFKADVPFQRIIPDEMIVFRIFTNKKSEYGECAKDVTFVSTDKSGAETDGKVKVTMNEKAIENARRLAGYNLLVTSELKMSGEEIYKAYHNLWRIEESFKIMKSELDARPVYFKRKKPL